MMRTFVRIACAALMLAIPGISSAVYNCTISSGGFSVAYSPTTVGTTIAQTSFTITCTRSLLDAASMTYSAAVDNGQHANGVNNRANSGSSYIKYDVYKDSGCATQWKGSNVFSGTLAFGGSTSASTTVSYWGCIAAAQSVAAGIYIDLVTMTLSYGLLQTATGTFNVSIATPASCSLTTSPGNVVFNYTSFGAAAAASTTFGVTCTSYLPYTMALDATSGALLGVTYTLALSSSSATGNGLLQTYTISGSIAAGQVGTCASGSCSATQARTLTITY